MKRAVDPHSLQPHAGVSLSRTHPVRFRVVPRGLMSVAGFENGSGWIWIQRSNQEQSGADPVMVCSSSLFEIKIGPLSRSDAL
jgi:hypothetical protein